MLEENKKVYEKLIRDKIIDLLLDEEKEYKAWKLNKKEFVHHALNKITEETAELREATEENNIDNIVEELCDVMELVYAIAKHYKISESKLTKIRQEKNKAVGNFDSMIFLDYVVENDTATV